MSFELDDKLCVNVENVYNKEDFVDDFIFVEEEFVGAPLFDSHLRSMGSPNTSKQFYLSKEYDQMMEKEGNECGEGEERGEREDYSFEENQGSCYEMMESFNPKTRLNSID